METPKIISRAIKNKTKEPATAKEFTSIPISDKIFSPIKRKKIIMRPAISEAFSLWIWPALFLRSITIGIFPIMSITANKIINAAKISLKFKSIL